MKNAPKFMNVSEKKVSSNVEDASLRLAAKLKSIAIAHRRLPALSFEGELHDIVASGQEKVEFDDMVLANFVQARQGMAQRLKGIQLSYVALCECFEGSKSILGEMDDSWELECEFVKSLGASSLVAFWQRQLCSGMPTSAKPDVTMAQASNKTPSIYRKSSENNAF